MHFAKTNLTLADFLHNHDPFVLHADGILSVYHNTPMAYAVVFCNESNETL